MIDQDVTNTKLYILASSSKQKSQTSTTLFRTTGSEYDTITVSVSNRNVPLLSDQPYYQLIHSRLKDYEMNILQQNFGVVFLFLLATLRKNFLTFSNDFKTLFLKTLNNGFIMDKMLCKTNEFCTDGHKRNAFLSRTIPFYCFKDKNKSKELF